MGFESTRLLTATKTETIKLRRARLRVVRGPDKGKELELGEQARVLIGTHPDAELSITDTSVSRRHAELRLDAAGYVLRDLGSSNGIRVGGVQVLEVVLDHKTPVLSIGETDLKFSLLDAEIEQSLSVDHHFGSLLGKSTLMRALYVLAQAAAASESSVLVTGESGTGKELLAESVHRASTRAEQPFVIMDCANIPGGLMEAELFGHERGAFTGAEIARAGLLEEADGGTLFLDEVAELPLDLQPKLLRVLDSGQVKRLGGTTYRKLDLRVLAATHRNLQSLVMQKKFRADLFYRLVVLRLEMPPLRHRLDDIALLARRFVEVARPGFDPEALLTPAVLAALSSYTWPGNVRELKNTIERLLSAGDLSTAVNRAAAKHGGKALGEYATARRVAIDRFEQEYCRAALGASGGSMSRAAEQAGITRQMFHHLAKKHGIDGG